MPRAGWRGSISVVRSTATAVVLAAVVLSGVVLASVGVGACSGGSGGSARPTTIHISQFAFMGPGSTKNNAAVHVKKGTKVVWINDDAILHTVTSGVRTYFTEGPSVGLTKDLARSGLFDVELPTKGARTTFTFTRRGTVKYLCSRHPNMDSEIVVE